MRTTAFTLLFVVFGILGVACTSTPEASAPADGGAASDQGSSSTPEPTATPDQPTIARTDLALALFTAEDLGGTWTVDTDDETTAGTPEASEAPPAAVAATPDPFEPSGCDYVDRLFKEKGAEGFDDQDNDWPTIAFSADIFGPFLTHGVTAPGESTAKDQMKVLSGIVSNCKSFNSVDENGTTTDFTVDRIDLQRAGDETVGMQISTAAPSVLGTINVEMALIVVREDGLTARLIWFGLNSKPDIGFLQRVTDRAAEKLQAVQQ